MTLRLMTLALLTTFGCGTPPPGSPTPLPPPPPTPPSESFTLRVINGWTRAAVAGARTLAGGVEALSDGDGRVTVVGPPRCVQVEVLASGYLARRMCAIGEITLWPAGDDAETAATRVAAFHNDALPAEAWSYPIQVSFSTVLIDRPDVRGAWTKAAERLDALTNGRVTLEFTQDVQEGVIVAVAEPQEACSRTPWPLATGGFCWVPTPVYFVDELRVRPDALTDPDVALRGIMWSWGVLNPHGLPGLMNATTPSSTVSPFETKTLHMIGLRRHVNLRWPDFDVVR